jgi:CRP-like cAMP-binding protein
MQSEVLKGLPLCQDFTAEQLDLMRPIFIYCQEPCGTVLFEQGDPAEYLYLIIEGEVYIQYKPYDGPALTVARIGPTGVVGWSAALGSLFYSSSAVCATDCQMMCLRGRDLHNLCAEHPETGEIVLQRLANIISERLRNTHPQVMAMLEQSLRIRVGESLIAG